MRRTLSIALVSVALATGGCSSTTQGTAPALESATIVPATIAPETAIIETSEAPSPPATEVTTMSPAPFSLASTAFNEGGAIPRRFTCDGEDVSPDLTWSGAPDGTRALALAVTDPDARDFVHWLVYDMTGTPSGSLRAAISSSPDAPPQGTNSFGRAGYGGPCPPSGEHHYGFVLYALDGPLELTGAPRISDLHAAMDGHVLAQATLTGTYHR